MSAGWEAGRSRAVATSFLRRQTRDSYQGRNHRLGADGGCQRQYSYPPAGEKHFRAETLTGLVKVFGKRLEAEKGIQRWQS